MNRDESVISTSEMHVVFCCVLHVYGSVICNHDRPHGVGGNPEHEFLNKTSTDVHKLHFWLKNAHFGHL